MNQSHFTTTFLVDQTPEEVFTAINNVRDWWLGQIEGNTHQLGDEFTYRYETIHYSKQKLTEIIPSQRVVWHVLEGQLNFVQDKTEWQGTDIIFEITKQGDQTEVRFTHIGLVPAIECFDNCSTAWSFYINSSLRNFIITGKAQSNQTEKAAG